MAARTLALLTNFPRASALRVLKPHYPVSFYILHFTVVNPIIRILKWYKEGRFDHA